MVSTPLIIPGYQVRKELYNGSRTIVYQAVREADNLPVVIKLLKNSYPSCNELVKFRNQYIIAKNLNFPGIIQTYSLEPYQNSYILVMEDFDGISLSEWIRKEDGGNLSDFLTIAISLCEILDVLYKQRIIHKDIKPSNILINPETKQVKLIDFCIASLLSRKTQTLISPNVLEGSLAYISPEQTGRMNRAIDYRSDYYSLGVTLYEYLTGELPFKSTGPMELVHCHIAKMPTFVSDVKSEIPPVIGEIIHKLLAKNADERYQNALGLKYDLETCLAQLQAKGEIKYFAIGKRDIGDRLIVPEKLYGREKEVEELLTAFNRVAGVISSNSNSEPESEGGKIRELILVTGCSGIGKTAVVNEVHKPIVKQRGYFIKGKFDQFNRNIPFYAFVQAFRDLMGQLLSESDTQLLSWKKNILEALGDNGQVVIEVIPELERIIGQQPPIAKISGTAAQNRFNLLFQKFIQVFTTKEHPLVIFLDDLQWADLASLNLIKLLISEAESGYLLIIGAYRDNEVDDVHPLILMVDNLKNLHSHIQTIRLSPLSQWKVNKLVADTISCSEKVAYPLAQLVYQKAEGNPFFTTQFLKLLYQDGLISFNQESRCWQCDITQVNRLAITDDVVKFMAFQLKRLPPSSQYILKIAACIGNQFDLATLAIVCEQSAVETATDLWKALQEGLILPQSEVYKFYLGENDTVEKPHRENLSYKFLHDRVQQAAYSLIPAADRQKTHFQIGELLLQNTSEQELDERIFAIANQFNMGIDQLQQPTKRHAIAQLNLLAGKKAKKSTAYSAALNYLNIGIQLLLSLNPWQTDYDLILDLYSEATEANYLTGEFEVMEAFFREVVQNTRKIVDATKVYKVKIEANSTQGKLLTAIDTAMEFLQPLGIVFPSTPTVADFTLAQQAIATCLNGKTIAELASLPEMENPELCPVMSILAKASTPAFVSNPELHRLIILKTVALSVQFGNTPASALAYAYYGMMLCGQADSIPRGYEFSKLALELVSRFADHEYEGMIVGTAHLFIIHWQEAITATFEPLLKAYNSSLESGYLAYAGYAIQAYCFHAYISAQELTTLAKEFATYGTVLQKIKQQTALNYHCINQQTVLNFIEPHPQPWELNGTVYNENLMLPLHEKTNDATALWCVYVNKSVLAYMFQNWHVAGECIVKAKQYIGAGNATFNVALLNFYDSLLQLALLPTASSSDRETMLKRVVSNQQVMQTWANYAPMNHQHRWELVEAEKRRVLNQTTSAIEYYDRAIATAKENGYTQDQALANELAAKFYLDWGKEKIAAVYMQDAYYCYVRWGAKAKTDHLEKNHFNLLYPILQPAIQSLNPLDKLAKFVVPNLSIYSSITTSRKNRYSSNINNALDYAAIIKASQILSSTIQLDELLHQLTQVILQNSGANRCVLVLPHEDGEWYVEAIATPQEIELCTQPLENHPRIPIQLIQYVKNTQELVVIEDVNTDLPVIDEYLQQVQPKSVLCLPLLNQGKLIGILYLKNILTSGVFTSDRIEVLQLLTNQAAISLENARLYQQTANYSRTLELEVERKTAALQQKAEDLEQALTTLQHTNEELIRATRLKDEFLANMSHELRTPLNAILGMTEGLQDEIFGQVTSAQINALKIIENSGSHLLELINDILDVAKIASGQITLNLHNIVVEELCTSVLDFIKQQALHKNIQLQIKFTDNLPSFCVDERRIRQVLINLLNNAIKFTLVGGHITLTVSCVVVTDKNYIRIAITDTGIGIAAENIDKVFQPFIQIDSSLNRQYEGTGLGLALVKRIVELHGGQVGLTSELGVGSCFTIDLPC
jgi:predicted ATPase/signal transduction histidine kinase/tRNA A-37 threonylcarbamoyl transferase component Bud32